MALTRWQSTIVDEAGNIQPFAELVILNEDTQGNAAVYHDREGNSQVSGAVVADEDGFAYFYAKGGLYRIQSSGLDIDWRHVPIGNMQEVDQDKVALLSGGDDADFATMPKVDGAEIVSSGSTNAGGWVQYADGTLIQWGRALLTHTSQYRLSLEISFPKEFDSINYAINHTPNHSLSAGQSINSDHRGGSVVDSRTVSGLWLSVPIAAASEYRFQSGDSINTHWMTVGRAG